MSLQEYKLPSLKDKINAQSAEIEAKEKESEKETKEVKVKIKKGRRLNK